MEYLHTKKVAWTLEQPANSILPFYKPLEDFGWFGIFLSLTFNAYIPSKSVMFFLVNAGLDSPPQGPLHLFTSWGPWRFHSVFWIQRDLTFQLA